MCVFACVYVCVPYACLVPVKVRRRHQGLELEQQPVVGSVGNWTQVPGRVSSWCSSSLSHLSLGNLPNGEIPAWLPAVWSQQDAGNALLPCVFTIWWTFPPYVRKAVPVPGWGLGQNADGVVHSRKLLPPKWMLSSLCVGNHLFGSPRIVTVWWTWIKE